MSHNLWADLVGGLKLLLFKCELRCHFTTSEEQGNCPNPSCCKFFPWPQTTIPHHDSFFPMQPLCLSCFLDPSGPQCNCAIAAHISTQTTWELQTGSGCIFHAMSCQTQKLDFFCSLKMVPHFSLFLCPSTSEHLSLHSQFQTCCNHAIVCVATPTTLGNFSFSHQPLFVVCFFSTMASQATISHHDSFFHTQPLPLCLFSVLVRVALNATVLLQPTHQMSAQELQT